MSAATIYSQSAGTIITTSGNSGSLTVSNYVELAVDINITAVSGTSPTLQFFVDRLGADGVWYAIWTGSSHTATGSESTSVGTGLTQASSFGGTIRLRWTAGGTTPSFTLSSSIIGK